MTLLLTTMILMAFAGVYAALLAMISNRSGDLVAALLGRRLHRVQAAGGNCCGAGSRRFSLA